MAGLTEEPRSVGESEEMVQESVEVSRCRSCRNRTGRAGAVWLAFHGLWCLRCLSDSQVDPRS